MPPRNTTDAAEVRVLLNCPECQAPASVAWCQLSSVLRCKSCNTAFWIGRTGSFVSERKFDKVQYECPRCGHVQQLISELRLHRICCKQCDLELTLSESESLPEAIKQAIDPNYVPKPKKAEPKPWSPRAVRCFYGTAFSLPIVAIVLIIWGWTHMSIDKDLHESVRTFTIANATGDRPTAVDQIVPMQSPDYDRWVHCAGSFKPSPSDQLDIQVLEEASPLTWVEVKIIQSNSDAPLTQIQGWRKVQKGTWCFDLYATLQRLGIKNIDLKKAAMDTFPDEPGFPHPGIRSAPSYTNPPQYNKRR
jgi:hypothetical protein